MTDLDLSTADDDSQSGSGQFPNPDTHETADLDKQELEDGGLGAPLEDPEDDD